MRLLFTERLRTFGSEPGRWLAEMGVGAGATVADLGAGRGLYTIAAAELVGAGGAVYAVEPDPERSSFIARRAASERLANVRVVQAGAESMVGIPDSSVDLAFSIFSLHHFRDRKAALSEARRVVKDGGRLYVRDFLWNRLLRDGTRREDVPSIADAGFARVDVSLGKRKVELTFTR